MKAAALILMPLALAACAPTPSQIEAKAPAAGFAAIRCSEVLPRLREEELRLAELTTEQETAARQDAAGVAIIGLPIGSMSGGNKKDEIASAKGRVEALRARQDQCAAAR